MDGVSPVKPSVEGLDGAALPARRKAEKVFGRGSRKSGLLPLQIFLNKLSPDRTDTFRLQLPPLSHRISDASSDDDLSSSSRPKESVAARVRRLKAELAEVEVDLAASHLTSLHVEHPSGKRKSVLSPKPPVDLLAELASVRERMVAVDVEGMKENDLDTKGWKERLERLSAVDGGAASVGEDDGLVVSHPSLASGSGRGTGLSEIDKRLAQLEEVIGPPASGTDDVSPPWP